jgi:hypothetical protein
MGECIVNRDAGLLYASVQVPIGWDVERALQAVGGKHVPQAKREHQPSSPQLQSELPRLPALPKTHGLLPACLLFCVILSGFLLACSSTVKMEALCSSVMSVGFQRSRRHYIPKEVSFHDHRAENLKSYVISSLAENPKNISALRIWIC